MVLFKKVLLLFGVMVLLVFVPRSVFAIPSKLVIDEFRIDGISAYDEYVVVANYGTTNISLENYSLARKTKMGTSYNYLYHFTNVHTLQPRQKITICHASHTEICDLHYEFTSVSLTDNNAIYILGPTKEVIDKVGYGEASDFEGVLLPNPEINVAYQRVAGQDTDNNFNDFEAVIEIVKLDVNADKIIITELMPDPDDGNEWFELYNPTNQTVSLKGLKICDQAGSTHCYYFTDQEALNPWQYKTYTQTLTKITLNNDGDWLELQDGEGNVLATSGDNYGDVEANTSYSLFNFGWTWTLSTTQNGANTFVDIIENEPKTTKTKKTSTKKATTKKATAKTGEEKESDGNLESEDVSSGVLGDEVKKDTEKSFITSKTVGILLIILAFVLLLGYTFWDKRAKLNEAFQRFRRRHN